MKIIGITCSCLPKSISQAAVKEFLRGASDIGHTTECIQISRNLLGCTGCHACKKTDSFCVQKDVLTRYFELLPEADVVVLGAGIYMGYPQGEAWTFMNRHFCLHKSVSDRSECRIAPGKKLYAMFAQGAPDNPEYRAHNEELLKPFSGWGFERMEPLILTARDSETALKKAYQLGNLL